MGAKAITLYRYLIEDEHRHPEHGLELGRLVSQISFAAKIISRELARAALTDELGLAGQTNVTGDSQKKLDVLSNTIMVDAMANSGLVSAIVSEEIGEVKHIAGGREAQYVLCIDPLDGSSNIDVNRAVGTIFGIYRRISSGRRHDAVEDVLRKGSEQVAAGYVMYGTSALLVFTRAFGVNGFTMDHDLGEFVLSHRNIRCPARGRVYAANLGHYHEWHPNVQKFVDFITAHDPATHRPYSLRYSGALVADLHACLIEGGLYFYPADAEHKSGKLRLLYECAPLAFVTHQAGGRAGTGTQRILDIRAETIHDRVPLVAGSAEDVALYEKFVRDGHP
jgi:fructose-1,6-bisphosphatase I